jgi:hypothetical protein
MPDFLTTCLQNDEANVIAVLQGAPFNHTFVRTFRNFTNGDLVLQVNDAGAPGTVGGLTDAGNKVVIHTTAP